MKLPEVGFWPVEEGLIPDDTSGLPRPTKRLMALLQAGSPAKASDAQKSWSLDFCLSPREFFPNPERESHVGGARYELTTLSSPSNPHARASGTGNYVSHPASLVFRSIGYKSVPLEGFGEAGIPFDSARGILVSDGRGRVVRDAESKAPLPGVYCAGWVKRGPTGVIASTMEDAFATADTITSDVHNKTALLDGGEGGARHGWEGVEADTPPSQLTRVVSWQDWQLIDRAEREMGKGASKERIKFTNTRDMLALLG